MRIPGAPLRWLSDSGGLNRIQLLQSGENSSGFENADAYTMAQSLMQKLPEVNIKKTIPLLDEKVSCPAVGAIPAFEASVSGSVDACMVVNVTLAVTAVGTLVRTLFLPRQFTHTFPSPQMPANFTKFGIVVGVDADLEGTLTFKSSASVRFLYYRRSSLTAIMQATLDSGKIDLFEVGIPGEPRHLFLSAIA